MNNSYRTAIITTAAGALAACCWLRLRCRPSFQRIPPNGPRSSPRSWRPTPASSPCSTAQGKEVSVVGPQDLYNQPVLSPDGKRVAVIKTDLDKETNDLWVFDVATGKGVQITFEPDARESATSPAWSPDGSQVAYVALRDGAFGLYRKPSTGDGQEELLYKSPGAPMTLTDWSQDGRFLTYFSTDLSGGALYALPLERGRGAKADRSLPQQVAGSGSPPFSRQPLPRLHVEPVGQK